MYERMPSMPVGSAIAATADQVGLVVGGAAVVGIAGHLAGNVLTGRIGPQKEEKEGDN
jgi:hydrogenase small subunit